MLCDKHSLPFHSHTKAVLLVSGHKALLHHSPTLQRLIEMRNPYIDPINIMQVCCTFILGHRSWSSGWLASALHASCWDNHATSSKTHSTSNCCFEIV
jgi:hypothetical protein